MNVSDFRISKVLLKNIILIKVKSIQPNCFLTYYIKKSSIALLSEETKKNPTCISDKLA